jgi:hypothetical protein
MNAVPFSGKTVQPPTTAWKPYVTIFWTEQFVVLSSLRVHQIRSHVTYLWSCFKDCLQKLHTQRTILKKPTGVQYWKFVDKNLKQFLGAFAKLWKPTISFVMSVCPSVSSSVCPHGTTRLPLDEFSWILVFGYFSKICRNVQVWLKYDKYKWHFTSITM